MCPFPLMSGRWKAHSIHRCPFRPYCRFFEEYSQWGDMANPRKSFPSSPFVDRSEINLAMFSALTAWRYLPYGPSKSTPSSFNHFLNRLSNCNPMLRLSRPDEIHCDAFLLSATFTIIPDTAFAHYAKTITIASNSAPLMSTSQALFGVGGSNNLPAGRT